MSSRLVAAGGIVALLALAWAASVDRRRFPVRTVAGGLALQFALALAILRTEPGRALFAGINAAAVAFIGYADAGIEFVFGRWPEAVLGPGGEVVRLPFVFAVRVLPIIVFMGSVFAILFHLGVTQRVVALLARGLRRTLALSGAESLATVANIVLGMTEAPLLVRDWVAGMTRSELFCVMTAGLATVAGSVLVAYVGLLGPEFAGHLVAASFMSAPAAVVAAKIVVPETETPRTLGAVDVHVPRTTVNVIDAAAQGATDGLRLALNVGAMLVAFVALIHMANDLLGRAGAWFGVEGLTFEGLLGLALAPSAWLVGIPWKDAVPIGAMMGVKTVLNEFIAYQQLGEALRAGTIDPRSATIASYALCGFANFGSLAILLGGIGGIAPERRGDVARDGLRAILAGSIATWMTAAVAAIVL